MGVEVGKEEEGEVDEGGKEDGWEGCWNAVGSHGVATVPAVFADGG